MLDKKIIKKCNICSTDIEVINCIPVIKYQSFCDIPGITHGFSTRIGGVSSGIYESMNLSLTRGDDPEKVMDNFRLFGNAVGIKTSQMVFTDQTHTTNVRVVTKEDTGKGILRERDYKDIDGFVTNCPGVGLVTFYADCVPLFFADPCKKVIALSHSGWRGTVGKIGAKTVGMMTDVFGCRPENIVAAIGPSICGDCYEVSSDVAEAFKAVFKKEQYEAMILCKGDGKYQLDLWKANAFILEDSGLLKRNISMPDICTCCNPESMWSHRKTGAHRGSLAAFLMITEGLNDYS